MGIIKDTLQKQIQNNNLQHFGDSIATLVEYNAVLNTAKIKYANPHGDGYLYRDNVMIPSILGGVTGAGIRPGQLCSIAFINKNIHMPIITGIIESNYANMTNKDQGAYIVDDSIALCEKPEEIIPMTSTWIDSDNTNKTKYINDFGIYTETDATKVLHELLNVLDKYKNTEQGITSLDTKSTIKFKDNGDIDIFVANNIGIRISPTNKSINVYGKLKINGKEIDLSTILNDVVDKE